jgi:hypothetical protein
MEECAHRSDPEHKEILGRNENDCMKDSVKEIHTAQIFTILSVIKLDPE